MVSLVFFPPESSLAKDITKIGLIRDCLKYTSIISYINYYKLYIHRIKLLMNSGA